MATPLSLAMGLIACWLVVRHRHLAPPPSRIPTVIGWVLAGISILIALGTAFGLAMDRSPVGWYATCRNLVGRPHCRWPWLAVLLTRRRRWLKVLAMFPAAAAAVVIIVGSSGTWIGCARRHRDRRSGADMEPDGACDGGSFADHQRIRADRHGFAGWRRLFREQGARTP